MEVSLQSFKKRFTYDPQKDLLGKGGFGEVYKAYDTEDHIFVALKISQGTADDKYNLISEIKRFKKLNHPNIVKHIEAYEVNTGSSDIHGKPIAYHVGILEYADNGTLADLLKKGTPDYRLIEDLAKDIIEGLAYLHSENIIHRDLKPTNILLFSEGEKLRAKITDFGIAKRTDATAASTQLVGTVEYMAPEFFSTGNITPAADVWSLGVMLLEALTGTHPFGKTTQGLSNEQIINNILNKDLSTATQNLRAPFKQIITRCLLRETNLRPQSATELAGLLKQGSDAFSEKTQVIDLKKKHGKPNIKINARKVWFGIAGILIFLLLSGGYIWYDIVSNKNKKEKNELSIIDRWVYIGDNGQNDSYFFDRKTVIIKGGIIRVTIKREPAKDIDIKIYIDSLISLRKNHNLDVAGFENYASSFIIEEFNCSSKEYRYVESYDYNAEGSVIDKGDYRSIQKWQSVTPETMDELILDNICDYINKDKGRYTNK